MHTDRIHSILKLAAKLSPDEPDEGEDAPPVVGQLPPMGKNMLPKVPPLKPFKMPKLSPLPALMPVAPMPGAAQDGQQAGLPGEPASEQQ